MRLTEKIYTTMTNGCNNMRLTKKLYNNDRRFVTIWD